jgi:hypothetical protein
MGMAGLEADGSAAHLRVEAHRGHLVLEGDLLRGGAAKRREEAEQGHEG